MPYVACVPQLCNIETEQQTLIRYLFYYLFVYGMNAVYYFFIISGMLVGGRWVEKALLSNACVREYTVNIFSRIYSPIQRTCKNIRVNLLVGASFSA